MCMSHEPRWVQWARGLQAIAQTGLHFSESEYDRERYQKILQISVEIFAEYRVNHRHLSEGSSRIRVDTLRRRSTSAAWYPKREVAARPGTDRRAVDLARRLGGLNDSPSEAVEREILEESGFQTKAESMLAIFDRAKHPTSHRSCFMS